MMAIPIELDRPVRGKEVADIFENAIREAGFEPNRKSRGFTLVPGSVNEVPEASSLTFSIPFEGEEPFERGTFDVFVEPSSGSPYYVVGPPPPAPMNHFDVFSGMRLRVFKNSKRPWPLVFQQLGWYRRQRPRVFWPYVLACCCIPVVGWGWGLIELAILRTDYYSDITRHINSIDELEGGIAPKVKAVLLRAFDQLKLQDANT